MAKQVLPLPLSEETLSQPPMTRLFHIIEGGTGIFVPTFVATIKYQMVIVVITHHNAAGMSHFVVNSLFTGTLVARCRAMPICLWMLLATSSILPPHSVWYSTLVSCKLTA